MCVYVHVQFATVAGDNLSWEWDLILQVYQVDTHDSVQSEVQRQMVLTQWVEWFQNSTVLKHVVSNFA